MSGLFESNVNEARGAAVTDGDVDRRAIVIGISSLGSGLSIWYQSGLAAQNELGYGDAVDTLAQIIEQPNPNGNSTKYPAAMYSCSIGTQGSYGAIDTSGVTGSAAPSFDGAVRPFGTYQIYYRIIQGGTLGTDGITFVSSLDGGRTESRITALGTALSHTMADGNSKTIFGTLGATLVAGDVIRGNTLGPVPGTSDVDDAFDALAKSGYRFALVVCDFPADAAMLAHFTTGLNKLKAAGKRVTVLCRPRNPNWETDETDSAWNTSIANDYRTYNDSRICPSAAYGLLTDAMTTRKYLRSDLAQYAADVVRIPRHEVPNVPADQAESNFKLVNAAGTTIGHDEGPRGSSTGLSSDSQGNRFRSVQRLPDDKRVEDVYSTVPWVLAGTDDRIKTLPVRRVANAMERVAVTSGNGALGDSNLEYYPAKNGNPAKLTYVSRKAIQSRIFQDLSREFDKDIQNARDAADNGLVQVAEDCRVTGGNLLEVDVTLAPLVKGILLKLNITLSVQQ